MSHDLGYVFITAAEMRKRIEEKGLGKGVVVVDVRDPKSYREGHVPGSALLTLKIVETNIQRIDILKETILVGADEAAAEEAARVLVAHAFPHVSILEGGIGTWEGELETGLENRWRGLRHEVSGKVLAESVWRSRPGKAKDLEAAFALYGDQARRWKGFITSNILHDPGDPNRYLFLEKWDDRALRDSFVRADDADRRELNRRLADAAERESEALWKIVG